MGFIFQEVEALIGIEEGKYPSEDLITCMSQFSSFFSWLYLGILSIVCILYGGLEEFPTLVETHSEFESA